MMNKKVLVINKAVSYSSSVPLLRREGYQVDVAPNLDMGLEKLDREAYDIIVVQEDQEAESWRLCQKIRHRSGLPIIVISASASAEDCVRALNAGADYFMRKPFGPLELSARAHSLIKRTSAKQAAAVGS